MNVWAFRFVNDTLKSPWLDRVLPHFSDKDYVIVPAAVALLLGLYFGGRRTRIYLVALMLAVVMANLTVEQGLKNAFEARRPYGVLEGVHVFRSGEWRVYEPRLYGADPRQSNSFPSSHAANAAATATVLGLAWPVTLWGTAPLAALVGLSRVYTGNHFPLDVLGGYGWGVLCGVVVTGIVRRLSDRFAPRGDGDLYHAPMPSERRVFVGLLGFWTILNLVYVRFGSFGLAGDEAQYWDWSRRLQLGYYSKPPMIAYFDALLVGAAGNKEWALRMGAVLLTAATVALVYALTLRIARRESAAMVAACAAMAMPATWAGSVLMTIDPLLVFFWALALYAFHRAASGGEKGYWLLAGLALGLGMLSKYTMLLLGLSLVTYLLLADRRWVRTPWPYAMIAITLACQAGVIYWNATHDWVSVRHTAAIGAEESGFSLGRSLEGAAAFWGGQLGLVSPILFGFFAWALVRCARRWRTEPDAVFLLLDLGGLFLFYAVVSFFRTPEPNWPVAAYLTGCVALGWAWTEAPKPARVRKFLAAALALGVFLGVAMRCTDFVYVAAAASPEKPDRVSLLGMSIDPDKDPTNELRGGRELGAAVSKHVANHPDAGPFVFSDRYQLTALLAFYTRGRPRTYCMNLGSRRLNQYDLWDGWDALKGRDGLLVIGGSEAKARLTILGLMERGAFERGEFLETVPVYRGKTLIKTYTISRLYGYTGYKWNGKQKEY